jgi:hypothetical protein
MGYVHSARLMSTHTYYIVSKGHRLIAVISSAFGHSRAFITKGTKGASPASGVLRDTAIAWVLGLNIGLGRGKGLGHPAISLSATKDLRRAG